MSSRSNRKSTISSHPATGFYSSSGITDENNNSGRSEDEWGDTSQYFPPRELKQARRRGARHEHRLISQCIDRVEIDTNDAQSSMTYITHCDSRRSTNHRTANSNNVSSYASIDPNRLHSLGNFFTSIVNFFRNNPKLTKYLLIGLLFYEVVVHLEMLIPRVISIVLRLMYPWMRYGAVIGEQFFTGIASVFTRYDSMLHATYCEFAAKYCRSRRLMCDVTCSFVDQVLAQSRPQIAPPLHK